MCKKATQKDYIEVCCIQREPSRFLPEIYLSLCLECSKFFRLHTEARKSGLADELYGKIMNARMNASGNVTIDMEDSYGMQLTFTETHLAEIQAVLPRLRADDGVANSENTLAMDDSVAWEDGKAIQPVFPIGKLSSLSVGNECSQSSNLEIDKEDESAGGALVFPVHITGEEAGDYKLVVYNGKLKRYTALKPEQRFISIVHQGRNRLIAVSLIEQKNILYVSK